MFDYLDLPQLTYWPDASILQAGDVFTVNKTFFHSPYGKVFYVCAETRARQVGCRVWVSEHPKQPDLYVVELERKKRSENNKDQSDQARRNQ